MSSRRARLGESGTALVESVVMFSFLVPLFVSGIVLITLAYSVFWIEEMLYQGAICQIETESRFSCEALTLRKIQSLLPFCKIDALQIAPTTNGARSQMQCHLTPHLKLRRNIDVQSPNPK